MAQYGMVVDVSRCIGCYNCFLACRDEYAGNDHLPLSAAQPPAGQKWIDVHEQERGSFPKVKVSYVPVPCLHCADASCVTAATDGAVYRRADGIVLIDPEKAVGQRDIVSSCPYRVIFWNEARNVPQKCTFCAHLLDDEWKEPRCVEACPTQALTFGDTSDPAAGISKLYRLSGIEALHPEYGMRPSVGYIGLPRRFIVGEVVFADKTESAAVGVRVSLCRGEETLTAATDNYGDFEFNGLDADAEYILKVEHPGYRPHERALPARLDLNIGAIVLEPTAHAPAPAARAGRSDR